MRIASVAAGVGAAVVSSAVAAPAGAQPLEAPPPRVAASGPAAEVGVGFGLVDAFGDLSAPEPPHRKMPGLGGAIELDAGWRLVPPLALGLWGFGAQLGETPAVPWSAEVFEAGAGVGATWHLRPRAPNADPWIALGSGWRGQWVAFPSDSRTSEHGLELLRARAGLDLTVSPSVAIAPVLGVSLSTYLVSEVEGGPWRAIPDPRVDTFVFAGVRATVDLPLWSRRGAGPPQTAAAVPAR